MQEANDNPYPNTDQVADVNIFKIREGNRLMTWVITNNDIYLTVEELPAGVGLWKRLVSIIKKIFNK